MGRIFENEKLRFNISCCLILLVVLFFIISIITDRLSLAASPAWDGTTVASNFAGGNGSEASPYLISTGPELALFKRVIEDNNNVYSNQHFELTDDIDMGNHDFGTISKEFSGYFDGRGFKIMNVKFTKSTINDADYYGFFSYVTGGEIKNLIMDNTSFVTEASEMEVAAGTLAAKILPADGKVVSINNVSIANSNLNFANTTNVDNNNLGGVAGLIGYDVTINNLYANVNISTSFDDNLGAIAGTINSDPGIVIAKYNITNVGEDTLTVTAYGNSNDVVNMQNQYVVYNDRIELDGVVVDSTNDYEAITLALNNGLDDYYWSYVAGAFTLNYNPITPSPSFSFDSDVFTPTSSTVDTANDIVYINDLEADYNYLKGLNYAEVRSTSLPSGESTGYYDDDYLVAVQLTYDGADINDDRLVGAVSPVNSESTNKFVYYKYYPLERNSDGSLATDANGDNYIRIELIDNPFSKRPVVTNQEYAFNGWVCNQNEETSAGICASSTFGFKKVDYTRYMDIPVEGGSDIKVYLSSSWVRASVITQYADLSSFSQMIMKKATHFEDMTETHIGAYRWLNNYDALVYDRTITRGNVGQANAYLLPRNSWYKTSQNGTTYTYVANNGNTYCPRSTTCYVYNLNENYITAGDVYDDEEYVIVTQRNNNTITAVVVDQYNNTYMYYDANYEYQVTIQVEVSDLADDSTAGGYFYQVSNPTQAMINTGQYYNNDGSVCTNSNSCTTAYKLIQYNDSRTNTDGTSIYNVNYGIDDPNTPDNENIAIDMDKYFYLVTRDTNIFRYTSGTTFNMANLEVNRPFTITGVATTGTTVTGAISLNNTDFTAQNDTVIENIRIAGLNTAGTNNSDLGADSKTQNVIYANSHNLKIGRNVTNSNNASYLVANAIFGGTNTTVSGTFRVIVESGFYYAYHSGATSGGTNSNFTLNEITILGSDYDRVSNTNSKLRFLIGVDGYSSSHHTAGSDSLFASMNIVKSGMFGYNSNGTANTNNTSGLYIGGRASRCVNSITGAKIEGGQVNAIFGGYGYNYDNGTNSTYIGMSGGTVRAIYGGAGHSTSYGNRIVNVTGGTVNYSILGGSDSYSSTDTNDGIIQGSTLIYVGGNVIVGTENDSLFGVESGSVFGAGGGNDRSANKGTVYNSHVIINGGTINNSVYGGGNYGSTGTQYDGVSTTVIDILSGTIVDSVYGASKSAGFSRTNYTDSSSININVEGGTIGNIYGGSNTSGIVYGIVNVNVNNGTVNGNVYGGGKGGYQNATNTGTYVVGNVNVTVGDSNSTESNPLIKGNVYGGSAYGTVNSNSNTANTSTRETTVTVNSGVVQQSVFGGGMGGVSDGVSYSPNVAGNATTTINGGSVGNVFGGNDAASYVKGTVEVYLNGGTVGNAYGGGNSTGQPTPYVFVDGSTVNNVFGGSNMSGTVNTSNVTVTSGDIGNVYGGNNAGGTTTTTRVTVNGGDFRGDIYGGGYAATSTTTNVTVNQATVNDVYGGGQNAGATTTNVNVDGATADEIFGGSNISGNISNQANVNLENTTANAVYGAGNKADVNKSVVNAETSTITSVYGGGNNAAASDTSTVNIESGTYDTVFGGGNAAGTHTSVSATVNYLGGTVGTIFGGSNSSGDITTTTVNVAVDDSIQNVIDTPNMDVYGGNNAGGKVQTTNVNLGKITCNNVYGGGNQAIVGRTNVSAVSTTTVNNLYGGGNAAGVTKISDDSTIDPNTNVVLDGGTVKGNLFGGGNEGIVSNNTNVYIHNGKVEGNAYAGGNGASAIVYGNSNITVDGNSIIGTASSTAPSGGCVFGSGNAASTGENGEDSNSTVNIAGGHIYGNVYGGAKMSTVFGIATVNIGLETIPDNSTLTKTDIQIDGSVYGGGESNESGSTEYDWNAISVVKGIDVNIDGTGYTNFALSGDIFGSGNASSSNGYSYIDIKNLGTSTSPNVLSSIQRTDICTIDSSFIEVLGQIDITNTLNDYEFSFNRIDELIIKNNTTLLVQNNANLVKAFTSGYDDANTNTFVKNSVNIAEDGTVSNLKSDNRLYTLSGINFNVNTNELATEFGKVTGMTFFGMYKTDGSDYSFGLYDKSVQNGDILDSDYAMYGGSYVQGLNYVDYNFEEDGFYSNFFEEDSNFQNDYTKPIYVAFIDPKKIGDNCNRWVIGKNLNTYKITLYASPFGSAGTEMLTLADFSGSNVLFEIESFDSSQLNSDVNLISKASVPRVAASEDDANTNFALSVKTESQEWTNVNTTNMLSAGGGTLNGNLEYKTDNTNSVPKLNFYLYHSKNVTTTEELGKCNLYMTVYVPTSAIDYSIETVQVEITIKGRENTTEAYASAINYGKYYDVFTMGNVNITSTSQFSTYYSLTLFDKQFNDIYGNGAFHALTTTEALPVGTMVTMIDFAQGSSPLVYSYEVDAAGYAAATSELQSTGEINYNLTNFKRMSSTNTSYLYSDSVANAQYYNSSTGLVDEEFIFIFDLSQTDGSYIKKDVPMLFNLYQNVGGTTTSKVNVYGNYADQMIYSTYLNDNQLLGETLADYSTYVYHNTSNKVNLTTTIAYDKLESGVAIIDTNYNSSAMGLNVRLYDSSNNVIASNKLVGTYFVYNGNNYFADADGVFRIKLTGKVSEISSDLMFVTDDTIDEGTYTLEYTLFASEDGLHNSDDKSVSESYTINVISSKSSIIVNCEDTSKLIIGETGLNAAGLSSNTYEVKVKSLLTNMQVMLEIQKRNINTVDTLEYTKVPFSALFTNSYTSNSENEAVLGITTQGTRNVTLDINPTANLVSGTYKLIFKLYDNGVLIDSETKYVIVDKQVNE